MHQGHTPRQKAEVEFLMTALHADVQNGLLYINGGCFTQLYQPPAPEGEAPGVHFGIVLAVSIPWEQTNRLHSFEVRAENEDGVVQFEGKGEVEVGRLPGVKPGTSQRVVHAENFTMPCPPKGRYRIVVEMNDEIKEVSFDVVDHPSLRLAS